MAGFDIVAQCEIDEYCQKVLALRFPESVKYKDIKELTGEKIKNEVGTVDIVAGGFPCQPFSVAGKQRGTADDRNLWPEMLRIIKEVRPAWVVGENVSGIIPIYLDTILADLETEGYAARTFVFPAHALGANHRRERIWVVAHRNDCGRSAEFGKQQSERAEIVDGCGKVGLVAGEAVADASSRTRQREAPGEPRHIAQRSENVANANAMRLQRSRPNGYPQGREKPNKRPAGLCGPEAWRAYWSTEPKLGRVAHGVSKRVDRLKALGNGQVVGCTAFIGQQIMDVERLTLPAAREKG